MCSYFNCKWLLEYTVRWDQINSTDHNAIHYNKTQTWILQYNEEQLSEIQHSALQHSTTHNSVIRFNIAQNIMYQNEK